MSEELNEVEQLFHAALELASPAERAGYLARACGGDAVLRTRVEKLLRAYETAGQFLDPETPPAQDRLPFSAPDLPPAEKPGDRIGQYILGEQIGEGGCCVVYVAKQVEPVRREVALKLVKVGMDTRQAVARFEAERQALALMDHPHIAKVFDAGVTSSGRPYFVMQLVRGLPITQYCDQHRLSLKQRLELFVQVAHAVQHAHQKGVIHRDLKPSNILVTSDDSELPEAPFLSHAGGEATAGAGEPPGQSASAPAIDHAQPSPRIIDFGIAKAMQVQLTDRAVVTWFGQFVGTPAYMSPEQAGMRSEDIDVRSDVYSLGALLYELLTGVTPFDQERLSEAGFDEIQQLIQETEPPKPSTRLHELGERLEGVAGCRKAEPRVLLRAVRGDLDWIVMKALEKDRCRRYETANAFAEDIERHLTHQPVLAGPPSVWYRTRKFARRHRVGVAAGAAAPLALVVGLSLALVEWRRALQVGEVARQDRDRAVQAEQQMRRERDRAVQAEMDTLSLMSLLSDAAALDRERMALNYSAARLARARLGPTNASVLSFIRPLARSLGQQGAWTNVLEAYLWLAEAAPGDWEIWMRAHAAAVAADQSTVVNQILQQVVKRFGDTRDTAMSLQVARAILIRTDSPYQQLGLDCARRAIQALPQDGSCQVVAGMAEYRRGRWSTALETLPTPGTELDPSLAALAGYFGAMARHQSGQAPAAREALDRATGQLNRLVCTGVLPADGWHLAALAVAARGEAERLILGAEASPPITAASLAEAREDWKSLRELLARGYRLGREAKWQESRDAYAQALKHPRFDWTTAQEESDARCLQVLMGLVFMRCGDHASHQRLCRVLLALPPDKPGYPKAERDATVMSQRYAVTCLFDGASLAPDVRQRALEMARFALARQRQRKDGHNGYVCETAGMAEYYAGDPTRAMELLREAEADHDDDLRAGAMSFRARVLQKLGRSQEAARVLQEAVGVFRNPQKNAYPPHWWGGEYTALALEEAHRLIGPEAR